MMKIHFDSSITDGKIWLRGDAPCGAGLGRSQFGIECSGNPADVTCKRCLKKLDDQIAFAAEAAPLTAEERLARIAEYIRGEGDIDTESAFDFINGRNSVLRVMRDLIEDKH